MGRSKNSTKNLIFGTINFLIKLLLNLVSRAVFIRFLNVEYFGLNGLFNNILGLLSLAELGVGTAIIYSMYKPAADGDTAKITALLRLYKKLYWIIGTIILIVGLALIPFLPKLIGNEPNIDVNLSVVYVVFLANNVISYIFAYRRALIFAYQRNDVESKVQSMQIILLNAVQLTILVLCRNYLLYIIAMPVFTLLDSLVIFILSYKIFPDIKGKGVPLSASDKKEITKNTSAMVLHKVGGVAVFGTDYIIISFFLGLTVLAHYSSYNFIITSLAAVGGLIGMAIKSSIGNLIVSADKEKTYTVFKSVTLLFFIFAGFCTVCLTVLFSDFISLWMGEDFRLDYPVTILIIISFYLTQSRVSVLIFKECAGLFRNNKFQPLIEVAVNLSMSLILVNYIGLSGVIIGTILSSLTVLWIEPYVLFKHYFKLPVRKAVGRYFLRYLIYMFVTVAIGGAVYAACYFLPTGGWLWFILKCAVCITAAGGLFTLAFLKTPEFKYLINVVKPLLVYRKGKRGNE